MEEAKDILETRHQRMVRERPILLPCSNPISYHTMGVFGMRQNTIIGLV